MYKNHPVKPTNFAGNRLHYRRRGSPGAGADLETVQNPIAGQPCLKQIYHFPKCSMDMIKE